jgi:hypothetical protein
MTLVLLGLALAGCAVGSFWWAGRTLWRDLWR